MPISYRSVRRSGGTLRFGERVNDKALREFIPELYEAIGRNHSTLTLDFSRTHLAYADAMLPLIVLVEHRRERGNSFSVVLPGDTNLRQLFHNANWGHLLDPSLEQSEFRHPRNLAASRYLTHPEQQDLVNQAMDVALGSMQMPREAITALEWSLNEVTDNVLNHAQATRGGLVQVSTFREQHIVKFVVADGGRGIPVAMREAYPTLRDDEALGEAIKRGVTSVPESGQGNGLAGSIKLAELSGGSFKTVSGAASLSVFRDDRGRYRTHRGGPPARDFKFPGTVVMVELRTDATFDVAEALSPGSSPSTHVSDIVDLRYEARGGAVRIRICDEATGFGTRHAGVELRNKLLNLLNAQSTSVLELDWSGVPLVTSSYADEAVGKLFVELGPVAFSTRVHLTGAEPLVRSLLDRAILQRAAQSVDHPAAG